jgi:hypothetical protein
MRKGTSAHAQRFASTLRKRADSGNTHAKDERHAGHSLIAQYSHLQRSALVDGGEQGNKAVDREVDVPDRSLKHTAAALCAELLSDQSGPERELRDLSHFPKIDALTQISGTTTLGHTGARKHVRVRRISPCQQRLLRMQSEVANLAVLV